MNTADPSQNYLCNEVKVVNMSEDYFEDKIGARFAENFVYSGVNKEESTEFMEENMNTSPGTPLATYNSENKELKLNSDEYWSLVSYAVTSVEKASRDHLGISWEVKAQKAREVDDAEEYVEAVEDEDFNVDIATSQDLEELVESELAEDDEWHGVTANDVAGIPTEQDYDNLGQ